MSTYSNSDRWLCRLPEPLSPWPLWVHRGTNRLVRGDHDAGPWISPSRLIGLEDRLGGVIADTDRLPLRRLLDRFGLFDTWAVLDQTQFAAVSSRIENEVIERYVLPSVDDDSIRSLLRGHYATRLPATAQYCDFLANNNIDTDSLSTWLVVKNVAPLFTISQVSSMLDSPEGPPTEDWWMVPDYTFEAAMRDRLLERGFLPEWMPITSIESLICQLAPRKVRYQPRLAAGFLKARRTRAAKAQASREQQQGLRPDILYQFARELVCELFTDRCLPLPSYFERCYRDGISVKSSIYAIDQALQWRSVLRDSRAGYRGLYYYLLLVREAATGRERTWQRYRAFPLFLAWLDRELQSKCGRWAIANPRAKSLPKSLRPRPVKVQVISGPFWPIKQGEERGQ